MSGIFGLIHLNDSPVSAEEMNIMHSAMAGWGPDAYGQWSDGPAGLGSLILFNTPEALNEKLPLQSAQGFVLTAEARLDNREELFAKLGIPASDARSMPDGELILRAYERWGNDVPDHLLGDWSFAAWHPREKKLFLARDHHGNTSLYYYSDQNRFAFASSRKALLALGIPRRLNEFFLVCVLTSWPAHHGSQTIEQDLFRLPPAHSLVLVNGQISTKQYWRLEDTPDLHLRSSQEYAEGLLDVYEKAVNSRLRSYRPVCTTLSGGLDSGSLTALAAKSLREQGKRLTSYTSVPLFDVRDTVELNRFGDELPFAQATADFAGNVDLVQIAAENFSPMQAVYNGLSMHGEPGHASANMYWIYEILQTARDNGYGTLLTGQGGNATISWTGKNTQKIFTSYYQNRQWKKIIRDLVFPILPISFVKKINARMVRNKLIWENTALRSSFIEQFDLSEKYLASYGTVSNSENWNTARQQRYSIIKPGRWFGGNYHAENGGEYGLDVRDPTLDKRVLEFTIAVPDKEYLGPDGYDRWLIRTAMNGLLPDKVRLNRRRGRQAGDIGYRLLKCSAEVESALSEMRRSELANRYIEIDRLDSVWLSLQHGVDRVNTHYSVTILTRGLMAGLYLSKL